MAQVNRKKLLVLIIHNVRSAHNVGSLFRTADGAGVERIFLTGYTPKPPKTDAVYMTSAEKALQKTALGAEKQMFWEKRFSISQTIVSLRKEGYTIVALEQSQKSIDYRTYKPHAKVALLVGNEVLGVDSKILKRCDVMIAIPMRGYKNSLNVAVACGIALYQITSTMKRRKI
ncbi:MAG TPA: RNA methyltransferase [Patescibacteria group bacterium]|nr:RNA methyltransferase [Patescibacteria group bacterium]